MSLTIPDPLRELASSQQFTALKAAAEAHWQQCADDNVLPLLALAQLQVGQRVEAIATSGRCWDSRQQLSVEAQVDLAEVYCLLQNIERALALLQPLSQQYPQQPLIIARLGWCRMAMGDMQQAQQLYAEALAQAPHNMSVRQGLFRLNMDTKAYGAAQTLLDEMATLPESLFSAAEYQGMQWYLLVWQSELWAATGELALLEQWLAEQQAMLDESHWVQLVLAATRFLSAYSTDASAESLLREALNQYPANIGLLTQLAELANQAGRIQQAVHCLHKAIRCAEQQQTPKVALQLRLAQVWLTIQPQLARQAAEKAMAEAEALQPSDTLSAHVIDMLRLNALNTLAQVNSAQQHYDSAAQQFQQVLAQRPHYLPALQSFGQQKMQLGDIDGAVELFEQVQQLDPLRGTSALINARRFPQDVATLEKLQSMLSKPLFDRNMRSSLLFQLAASWEKLKQYDKAFALVSQANQTSRQNLRYDAQQNRDYCARLRQRFSSALFAHRKNVGHDSRLPVFVVGMPRSGTTLVEQIIAGHTAIYGAGELGVIPQRIQRLSRWERHVGSGRSYPDCVDDITAKIAHGIAEGIVQELRELAAESKPDAQFVVDKLPHNFQNIGLIKLLFPHARIISVRRDPRDIALSNYFTDYQAKHGGMGFAYDLTDIGEQLADHNLLMHHWQQVFPGQIHEIQYEQLVADTEEQAKRMLDYIGVEWEPQVLNFNQLQRPVKTASVWQVRQPIYTSSTAKWKRYKSHLAELIKGTNAPIRPTPITDMLSLPVAGMFSEGFDAFKAGKLDDAEYGAKKMLHHNPNHAGCYYLLGEIYLRKGHLHEGLEQLLKSVELAPWNYRQWMQNAPRAYRLLGDETQAVAIEQRLHSGSLSPTPDDSVEALLLATSLMQP